MTDFKSSKELLGIIDDQDAISLSKKYLMNNYGVPKAIFESGEGSYLIASDGRRVLDFLSGIAVCSLGHAPASVAEAVSGQAKKLIHTSNFFANDIGPRVAYLLDFLIRSASLGDRDQGKVFFSNSGAEANEAAIKLARKIKGPRAYKVIGLNGTFHGRTLGALSATGQNAKREPFEPLVPGFFHVDPGDLDAIEAHFQTGDVAAFITEPILGEAGVIPIEKEFLVGVRQLCDDYGVLMIFDEIQCGFGRTGAWFAHHHLGIDADMVTMAKAIASGMPVGALWARGVYGDGFSPGDHGTTFGGGPLAMSAALATITTMIDLDVCALASSMGRLLKDGLEELLGVDSVRGMGLLIGVALSEPVAQSVAAKALEDGLIVNAIGDRTLRLAPPLTVSVGEINQALEILAKALS